MRRFSLGLLGATAVLIAVPPGASAATQIGQTFTPLNGCTEDLTLAQSTSPAAQYEAPSAGVITSWSFQAPASASVVPRLKFKVARRAGGNKFTIIGSGPLVVTPVAGVLNTYSVQIPVLAGDLIGFYVAPPSADDRLCSRAPAPGYVISQEQGDLSPGTTATFASPGVTIQLDVSANLETTPCKGLVPTMAGTAGPDTLTGTPNADVIVGLEGRDTINGLAGNDVECGGTGKDTLKGAANRDTLLGQQGKDKLKGGGARDVCKGGKGNDSASKCEVEKSI